MRGDSGVEGERTQEVWGNIEPNLKGTYEAKEKKLTQRWIQW